MSADAVKPSRTLALAAIAAAAVIGLAALSALLTVVATHGTCTGTSAAPSADATRAIRPPT